MRRGRKGISAVLGGIMVLAIVFTVILPLVILSQHTYGIFLNESNSRRIFDADRLSEFLDVNISQDPQTLQLTLMVSNQGPIHVNVVRVWAIDVDRQASIPTSEACLRSSDTSYIMSLPPGMNGSVAVQQCVQGFTGVVQFLAVTERGRIFSSEKIRLVNGQVVDFVYPFTLTVSIINMKKGRWYEVIVEPLGDGNVSPRKFTHKATAANENVTVAFGAFAGRYRVSLYENGRLVQLGEYNPKVINVPETTAVIFDLGYKPITVVDLVPIITAPNKVNKQGKDSKQIQILISIQLPKDAEEPVTITSINNPPIRISGAANIVDECYIEQSGFILMPGQRAIISTCVINVNNDFTIIVDSGMIVGVGENSNLNYVNKDASKEVDVVGGQ
jgi:hypothetical protein